MLFLGKGKIFVDGGEVVYLLFGDVGGGVGGCIFVYYKSIRFVGFFLVYGGVSRSEVGGLGMVFFFENFIYIIMIIDNNGYCVFKLYILDYRDCFNDGGCVWFFVGYMNEFILNLL